MSGEMRCEVAVIGAGIVGIACAYFLQRHHNIGQVVLIDPLAPMSLTSAQSGENYRNWWPHPVMTAFTDHSIDLMEEIARESGNRINMVRRGYALASRRKNPEDLFEQLHQGYGGSGDEKIRHHKGRLRPDYQPPEDEEWQRAPDGVDVLQGAALIQSVFPHFDPTVETVLHIRRGGDIRGQQMGQLMLEAIRAKGGQLIKAAVTGIERDKSFILILDDGTRLSAQRLVNAAGPYLGQLGGMLGETLPVETVLQQKIAFEDREEAIPRQAAFGIDLDPQVIDWGEEERALLAEDPQRAWLNEQIAGGVHCRPEGGLKGKWIKLGWAFNREASQPVIEPSFDPAFPEIVLRGAARLHPSLKTYYGRLPRSMVLYGGYYTLTSENWPLLGAMRTKGAFVAGALSGYGTMGACAAGAITAASLAEASPFPFADKLSLARYDDKALMDELAQQQSRGLL